MRALITGASRGIGRATALRLARDGYEVWIHHRKADEAAPRTLEEVRAAGGSGRLLRADLQREEEVARVAEEVGADRSPLDLLVLNAGEYPRVPLEDLAPGQVRDLFQVHVFAPLELVRRLKAPLARARPGRVVFVSSVLAQQGSARGAHYAAAKAAVLGLSYSLARELAPDVRVNAVAPGSIDTDILAADSPARRAERIRTIPLGRLGRPEEVADAIAFLGSKDGYLTGATLSVNGGLRIG